jgi:hypothetical protein
MYSRVNPECNKSKVKLGLLYVRSEFKDKTYKAQTYLEEVIYFIFSLIYNLFNLFSIS